MKKLILLIIISNLTLFVLNAQVTLTIVIKSLENSKGTIYLDFRDGKDKSLKHYSQKIIDNQCKIVVDNLSPGKYSFKYFHDENNNVELDTNILGIPKEGYGFSNDAEGKFGPPDFEETVFEIIDNATIVCHPKYIY